MEISIIFLAMGLSCVAIFILINWFVHLTMNWSGRFSSYKSVVNTIKKCPHKWEKSLRWGRQSAFVDANFSEYQRWYLHASIIRLDGVYHILSPLAWFRYRRFLRNWDLPIRDF